MMIQIDRVPHPYTDIDGRKIKVFRIKSDDVRICGYILDILNSLNDETDIRDRLISDFENNDFEKIKGYLYTYDEILSNDRHIINHKLNKFLKMVEREYKMNEIGI